MTLTKLYFFSTVELGVPRFEMWIKVIMEFDSWFCETQFGVSKASSRTKWEGISWKAAPLHMYMVIVC